ncbi:hypothetical protein [Xanthomonas arboricola]|uniref:hypothetical protein n=1 Tax=Xanthomonas arboricola TaxID=56448 RepID=UPI001EE8035B|nr:hypothetical protein [Xanthomonas arboricola]
MMRSTDARIGVSAGAAAKGIGKASGGGSGVDGAMAALPVPAQLPVEAAASARPALCRK